MNKTISLALLMVFLLPSFAQADKRRSKKKTETVQVKDKKAKNAPLKKTPPKTVRKTAAVRKRVAVKPASIKSPYEAARLPADFDISKLAFFPPSKTFVPSTKTSVMLNVVCSQNKYIWITTESWTPLSLSFIIVNAEGIQAQQPDGKFRRVERPSNPKKEFEKPTSYKDEDVILAENILKAVFPVGLSIMPKSISIEKNSINQFDAFDAVEQIRDHIGRAGYDVNVAKPSNCYFPRPESKELAEANS
jgi:hypothetical protein